MIKLVLTDLDGTFLNKSGSFDQSYYEKVKTIMDQNNVIFPPVLVNNVNGLKNSLIPIFLKISGYWVIVQHELNMKVNIFMSPYYQTS